MEKPVDSSIRAGDETVEACGNEEDDLGHFLLPQIAFFADAEELRCATDVDETVQTNEAAD